MNKDSIDEILKDFLDEVDYTLEVETPGVGDKDFYDRPFVEARAKLKALLVEARADELRRTICHKHGWNDSCFAIKERLDKLTGVNDLASNNLADSTGVTNPPKGEANT